MMGLFRSAGPQCPVVRAPCLKDGCVWWRWEPDANRWDCTVVLGYDVLRQAVVELIRLHAGTDKVANVTGRGFEELMGLATTARDHRKLEG